MIFEKINGIDPISHGKAGYESILLSPLFDKYRLDEILRIAS